MRVLVVHNRYRSGQPSGENAVVEEEAGLLAGLGCTVERLEVDSDAIAAWPAARRAAVPASVVWSPRGARLVASAAARFAPDVVHVHNTFPLLSPAALRAARATGAAVVQTLHNFRPLCPAATFLRDGRICEDCLGRLPLPALRHGCYRGSRAATAPLVAMISAHRAAGTWHASVDRFVLPSAFARDKYLQAGWPADRLAVKANTVADPGPGPESGRARSGFACLARLSPEKGVGVLLDAWERAFPGGGPGLAVVGGGEAEESLRARARDLAGVDLTGALDRDGALRRLGAARALVVPSRCYEVFPRVAVEAFALGVPVVAARIGSLPEIVRDGESGLLFEPGSAGSLAEALARLARDPALEARLGAGARRAYEQRFSPAGTTARLLEIYADALAAREVRAA